MGHVEMCPLPARCQKFDLGLYFLARSGWRQYGLLFGAAPEGSGETEPLTQMPGEAEPPTQRSGEAEPAHLGVGWSCSRALDYSDESMLMTISSSSSGTLVLVPDSSLRTYGGVEYFFGGFSKWEDSEGPGLLLSPTACPRDCDSLSSRMDPSQVWS